MTLRKPNLQKIQGGDFMRTIFVTIVASLASAWTSVANAYDVHVFGRADSSFTNGGASADFTFSTSPGQFGSGYYELDTNTGYPDESGFRITSNRITGACIGPCVPGNNEYDIVATFTDYTYEELNPANPYPEPPNGASFAVRAYAYVSPDGLGFPYSYNFIDGGEDGLGIQIVVSGSGPSTVPLPASAPLFGSALLALGLAGLGFRSARTRSSRAERKGL
jgi:hypothetical protein